MTTNTNKSLPEKVNVLVQAARNSLLSYCQVVDPRYMANFHHEIIAEKLERALKDVKQNKKVRIILEVPPRHGKSELATIKFPSWALGKEPDLPLIITSYSAELAEDFGLKTRDLMQNETYQSIFETRLRSDSKAKDKWMTTKGGSYTAVGVGGAITGRGAKVAIIDDPFKNREDAESPTYRRKVWEWYTSTLYTRLEGYGAVIVIMTRWHMDDLVGKLLQKQEDDEKAGVEHYDKWDVIRFPAIAEEDEYNNNQLVRKTGEALWPSKYPLENLLTIRNQNIYDWASLYQQDPILSENQEFKAEQFKYYEEQDIQNLYLKYTTTVDPAISQKSGGDNTVIRTVGKEVNGPRIFLIREDAGHYTPSQTVDLIFKHRQEYKSEIFVEVVAYQQALKYAIEEEQRKREVYFVVNEIKSRTNKQIRIRGLLPLYAAGVIYHRISDKELERELLQFPRGRFDDRIDCLSMQLEAMQNTKISAMAKQTKKLMKGYFRSK